MPAVLVLARDFDPVADAVVMELTARRRVQVFRTDLADFPTRLRLAAQLRRDGRWEGRLWNDHHAVELADVQSIWNRNPSTYGIPPGLPEQQADFIYRESKLALGGILGSLDVLWANHPNRCADAIWKANQWKVAAFECGLEVAPTVITNDPSSAQRFMAGCPPEEFITKALGPAGIEVDGEVRVAYTRRLTTDDPLEAVSAMPTVIQRFVPKAYEVRLTVIGSRWFPIAIHARTEAGRTDWRSDRSALEYRSVTVPDTVAAGVATYLKRMNLAYAGLDFVVTPGQRRWVLLECNSGPEFGFLEAAAGAPMTEAMADLLEKGLTV